MERHAKTSDGSGVASRLMTVIEEAGVPAGGSEEGNDAAVAPADEMGGAGDHLLKDADRLPRHVAVMEFAVGVGGISVAATVKGDDTEVFCATCSNSVKKGIAGAKAAVQEEKWSATAAAVIYPCRVSINLHAGGHAFSHSGSTYC